MIRVAFLDDGAVSTLELNMYGLPESPNVMHNSIKDLPEWMQERVAVLTASCEMGKGIPGFGIHVSYGVFWLAGEGDDIRYAYDT